ncbi:MULTISPECIES: AAA family ATPase [unclassified Methanoculleus]|jgi:predicted ATPase|uniref:AAA family ATPase n=1 Tax=Methanoculleus palmolei TaxID=72612 RepID=A0ABD8A9A1_9EURY|nr:AAA family ATPase [Methanoculleus palmolei]
MLSDLYVTGIKLAKDIPSDNYLYDLPVIKHLQDMEELPISKHVTFFVGENGIGKSTLIEAIAVSMGFNPEGGTINFNFSTEDSHSELYRYLTVCKGVKRHKDGFFLRAESFYNVATNIDRVRAIPSYGGVSLHAQSHGESFMALVENRFGGNGLYILDEPEAALSPSRLLQLMCCIDDLVKHNSQFIISTHSPILMAFPDAEVFELSEKGINSIPYQETEHFRITKQFVNAPEKMLKYLLE